MEIERSTESVGHAERVKRRRTAVTVRAMRKAMMDQSGETLTALHAVLDGIGDAAIAVSGGVDSVTLAFIAQRRLGARALMVHAVSPAVPPEGAAGSAPMPRAKAGGSRSSTLASSATPIT